MPTTTDEDTSADTAEDVLSEVEQMAAAWCSLISCRDGFDKDYDSVDACAASYGRFWTDETLEYNAIKCFEDLDAVVQCTEALLDTPCGDATPAECTELITCQNSQFPPS